MSKERAVEEVVVAGFAPTPEGTKDLLLSCLCDAKGAVLRVPLVEEDVDVHKLEEDEALAGAGG
jgi:stress response protein YsnF